MKNSYCDLPHQQIRKLPERFQGLLLSPFQWNLRNEMVAVPEDAFKEMIDLITEFAVQPLTRPKTQIIHQGPAMFDSTPAEFAELRAKTRERALEELQAKQNDTKLNAFFQDLRAELNTKMQLAKARLLEGTDVSHILFSVYAKGCNDAEQALLAHKLVSELTEVGFEANVEIGADSHDGLNRPGFQTTYVLVKLA